MRRAFGLGVGALLAVAHVASCGSDHDALKKKPPSGGGTGGTELDATPDSEPDAPTDQGPDVFVEPSGTSKLTLLHGVVDAKRIAFCFSKVADGVPQPAVGAPLPSAGLAYGSTLKLAAVPGLDPTNDAVLVHVLAGDFSLLAGKSCEESLALAKTLSEPPDAGSDAEPPDASVADDADADAPADVVTELPPPPALRAADLPVLPAGTLSAGFSLLLAATGCIGGPAFASPSAPLICGTGYTPSTPTFGPLLVTLSRVGSSDALGLQVVNAARAADPIDIASSHPKGSSIPAIAVAYDVVFGSVSPRPPLLGYSATAFGSPISASTLDVSSQGSSVPLLSSTWKDALAAGGQSDVQNGSNYAVVLLGPRPNTLEAEWWNGPKLVVLASDPVTQ